MKKLLLSFAFAAGLFSAVEAQIVVSGNITAPLTTWTNDNIYILNGWVYVQSGASLVIEPGTIIKGDFANKGALIIERGAKIIADGTAEQPIVFTSQKAVGQRSYGDWGGLIICGNASVNAPGGTATIEGGVGSIYGGGVTPNDDDSSGVLRYVRLEFGGIPFQPNSEINGLTLGGVGRKTVIDYIQVSYAGDDAYEMFGGTVNLKHIVAYRNWDDDFDTDFGYSGKVQWAISMRDPNIADQSSSNGFESDNDATGSANSPFTSPTFSNVTIYGPYTYNATINNLYKSALHIRRNSRTSVFNSVFMGYPNGFFVDGTASQLQATNDVLQFKDNVLCQMNDTLLALSNGANFNGANSFNVTTWFNTVGFNNSLVNSISTLDISNTDLNDPSHMLNATSPLMSGANFTHLKLTDPFFTPTTYRGAFGATDWTTCWAEWDPQNEPYNATIDNSVTATVTPSGATTFCQGGSVDLNANTVAGATYLWSNGATTEDITVTTSGNYYVTITSSNRCTATSTPIAVTVNPLPTVTISASGATSFCTGGSVDLTSSQASGNVWSTTATTQMITVNASGSYSVTFTDGNSCSNTSNTINVSVSASPAPTVTTSGSTTICQGDAVTLTASTSDSYVWNLNGTPISGATNQTYDATASGVYTVTVTNTDACDGVGTSSSTAVFVNPTPTASATYSNNGLTYNFTNNSLGATSYFWNFGDGNNSTQVNPSHTYTSNTNITVQLIAVNGACSDTLLIVLGFVNVQELVENVNSINLYPNPVNNIATLQMEVIKEGDITIEVIDITGKIIRTETRNNVYTGTQQFSIDANELQNGLYFINIVSGEYKAIAKMIVQH